MLRTNHVLKCSQRSVSIDVSNILKKCAILKKQCSKFFLCAVVLQSYETDCHKVHVMVGNSGLIKCEIPSFVADFVKVEGWLDSEQEEYHEALSNDKGKLCFLTSDGIAVCVKSQSKGPVHPDSNSIKLSLPIF